MMVHLHHDWLTVVGKEVNIWLNGHMVRRGIVDAVTNDETILWLMADGPHLRQMIEREVGYEVWLGDKA